MGKYARAIERTGLRFGAQCSSPPSDIIPWTYDKDPLVRRLAAKALCPCAVRANVADVWDRLLQMTSDPDPGVRHDVVHALGDGSPVERAFEIAKTLEQLHNDPDPKVRKRVRFVLTAYRKTGRLNVL